MEVHLNLLESLVRVLREGDVIHCLIYNSNVFDYLVVDLDKYKSWLRNKQIDKIYGL